jgi:hypothetical protein
MPTNKGFFFYLLVASAAILMVHLHEILASDLIHRRDPPGSLIHNVQLFRRTTVFEFAEIFEGLDPPAYTQLRQSRFLYARYKINAVYMLDIGPICICHNYFSH